MASRRTFLKALAGVGVAVVVPAGVLAGWVYAGAGRSNLGTLSFHNPLRIPPLLDPVAGGDDRKRFELTLQEGQSEFLPGTRTATWGANGPYLGPTVRVSRGERVELAVTNQLPETTTLHWHGMHLPAEMDGGPHQPIEPGQTWRPRWTVDQPATTLWYHPHLHRTTARHVYRGVAGLFLIDDPATDALPLPAEYGVDDVPLVLQDKKLKDDGTLDTSKMDFNGITVTGLLGDKILVNGTYDPYFELTAERTRFRLLNGSNARIFYIGFVDDREFWQIATDSGLLPEPRRLTRLLLSPGERAEIVVDASPGEELVMRSFPPPLGTNFVHARLAGGDDTFDLLKLVAAGSLRPAEPLPERLAQPTELVPAGEPFRLKMGDFLLNNRTMDPARLDHTVTAGAVETWEIVNSQPIPHNFHIHGCSFQVIDVDGEPPADHQLGVKDTVYVQPYTTVRLAVRFLPYSDPVHPYMFHCHILAHEDAGMMGQFVTVAEPDRAAVASHWGEASHHGHG
ncbi:MAG TPA: multicopper oxidase domain-containing protein [Natronosporangium sp.]